MKRITLPLIIFYLLAFAFACEETPAPTTTPHSTRTPAPIGDEALPDGDRLLNLAVNIGPKDDFDAIILKCKEVGMQGLSLSVFWDDIETAPGVYEPDPNWLEIANMYYAAVDLNLSVVIPVIDTNRVRVPEWYADKSLDDPEVVAAFNQFLEYVADMLPDVNLASFSIGNEIDLYLGNDQAEWEEFIAFYGETSEYARGLFRDVPVGTKATFSGLTGEARLFIKEINRSNETIHLTYYPLNADFTIRPPETVHADFQAMIDAFPGKQIYLLEAGYPSGIANDSSEQQQAEFIHEMFLAWDSKVEWIRLVEYVWLTDIDQGTLDHYAVYYGSDHEGFISYLATLGLRSGDGVDKPAWEQYVLEAELRGWR